MLHYAPRRLEQSLIASIIIHVLIFAAVAALSILYRVHTVSNYSLPTVPRSTPAPVRYAPAHDTRQEAPAYIPANTSIIPEKYTEPEVARPPSEQTPSEQTLSEQAPMPSPMAEPVLSSVEGTSSSPDQAPPSPEPAQETSLDLPLRPQARRGAHKWRRTLPKQQTPAATPSSARQAAHAFAQSIQQSMAQRHAQAVYVTKEQQVQAQATAQMHEIMDKRFRQSVVMALHHASVTNRKLFSSYRTIDKDIEIILFMSEKGELEAVEFTRSTGYSELDRYIVDLIKLAKRLPQPPRHKLGTSHALRIPIHVNCDATTQVLGFLYPGGGDYFS